MSHLGISCFTKTLCMRRNTWAGTLLRWSCQSPIAHSCGLLNHLNSFCRGMFKLNTKFDADLLLNLLGHFECYGHTVPMLTPWSLLPPLTSTVKSSLFVHVHSSPLSLAAGYINVRTIFILTMVGLFLADLVFYWKHPIVCCQFPVLVRSMFSSLLQM